MKLYFLTSIDAQQGDWGFQGCLRDRGFENRLLSSPLDVSGGYISQEYRVGWSEDLVGAKPVGHCFIPKTEYMIVYDEFCSIIRSRLPKLGIARVRYDWDSATDTAADPSTRHLLPELSVLVPIHCCPVHLINNSTKWTDEKFLKRAYHLDFLDGSVGIRTEDVSANVMRIHGGFDQTFFTPEGYQNLLDTGFTNIEFVEVETID